MESIHEAIDRAVAMNPTAERIAGEPIFKGLVFNGCTWCFTGEETEPRAGRFWGPDFDLTRVNRRA
ncbi:MAG: hypothetical protein GY854_20820 [Deltaproteobacteria bacterium]|nr:hypothetical protein [Deltaproteobacteria bacterium]